MNRHFALAALVIIAGCVRFNPLYSTPLDEGRPGLGTRWGEARVSHVRHTVFERASPIPLAQVTLHYDDRDGVVAMAGRDAEPRLWIWIPVHSGVSVAVVGERGWPYETVWARGRAHVVGQRGERYALRVRNETPRRFEIVASVDGLDVIDGQRASGRKRGYLVRPFSTLVIDGFRQSADAVAAFRFGSVSDSYAARTGDDRNVGVIGLALFAELEQTPDPALAGEVDRRLDARPFAGHWWAQPPP